MRIMRGWDYRDVANWTIAVGQLRKVASSPRLTAPVGASRCPVVSAVLVPANQSTDEISGRPNCSDSAPAFWSFATPETSPRLGFGMA